MHRIFAGFPVGSNCFQPLNNGWPVRSDTLFSPFEELPMPQLTAAARKFVHDDDGAALVEYAILVALIAVVAIFFVTSLGTKVSEKFSGISGSL